MDLVKVKELVEKYSIGVVSNSSSGGCQFQPPLHDIEYSGIDQNGMVHSEYMQVTRPFKSIDVKFRATDDRDFAKRYLKLVYENVWKDLLNGQDMGSIEALEVSQIGSKLSTICPGFEGEYFIIVDNSSLFNLVGDQNELRNLGFEIQGDPAFHIYSFHDYIRMALLSGINNVCLVVGNKESLVINLPQAYNSSISSDPLLYSTRVEYYLNVSETSNNFSVYRLE